MTLLKYKNESSGKSSHFFVYVVLERDLNKIESHQGIRQGRRYPRSPPGEQAPRSTSGVCELDSASLVARRAQFKSDGPPKKENGIPRGIPSHPGIRALHEDSSPCRLQASLTRSAARM